ncbi:hypothetical protein MtrunA17_Chr3g0110321 [Medicago truncatula]|uniref:Transmembrane protein n=1 Tax=Medicago truncatula TaxID=3880 RepID=A0A396IR16_MEDTR|nr:hypothetical protein MtrunA17_Chr3g0110321 [Medicago truncatula]
MCQVSLNHYYPFIFLLLKLTILLPFSFNKLFFFSSPSHKITSL